MKLVIEGETTLFKRLNGLNDVMQRTFWLGVQEDFQENLDANIRPHSKSGKLERNAYVKPIDDGVEGGVRDDGMMVSWNGAKINYASFVEYGTKAHDITPKNKKALRWVGSGGAFAFAKKVRHPGTDASHFLQNAAKTTFNNLEKIFNQELKQKGIV